MMLLLVAIIAYPFLLRQPSLAQRRRVRRQHFWIMLGLAAFVLGHVVINSSMFQFLLAWR